MELPRQYIRIARDITGYWGAYPPLYPLSPGMIGKPDKKNGAFVREDYLKDKPGYDPVAHAVEENAPPDANMVWTTNGVSMETLAAGVAIPGIPASGKIRVHFGDENEAAIICSGIRYSSFSSLSAVKKLMLDLQDEDWHMEQCVVTEVVVVKAAWIFYATEKDQAAEFQGATPLDLSGFVLPIDALKELSGKFNLAVSFSGGRSAGITCPMPNGGTPLFRAIKIKKGFITRRKTIEYLRGPDSAFEEATFGEA